MSNRKWVNGKWWYNKIEKTAKVSFPDANLGAEYLHITFPNGQTRVVFPGAVDVDMERDFNVYPDEQITFRVMGNVGANVQLRKQMLGVAGQIRIDNYVDQNVLTWQVERIDRLCIAITSFCEPTSKYSGDIGLFLNLVISDDYVPPPPPPPPPQPQGELKLWCKTGGVIRKAKKVFTKQNGVIVPVKKIIGG